MLLSLSARGRVHFAPRFFSMSTMAANRDVGAARSASPPLVMQLIVHQDLVKEPGWTMGPMMAQAAHAATAVIAQTYSMPSTQQYLAPANLTSMRKIVLQTAEPLHELSARLTAATSTMPDFPSHHLWIEEPEHLPTVLAMAPNTRPSTVKKILANCSLLKS